MAELEKDIDSIYTYIGKFAVEFELICHTMESGIRCMLGMEGLENERIGEIILAGLTAEPLSTLFQSLCYEHLKPDDKSAEIIDHVFSTFQKLISARNDLLHGKWFLFGKELEGRHQAVALGQKLRKKKTGSAVKRFEYDIENFQSLYEQARLSLSNMAKLSNCIAGRFPITKNFKKIENGKYEALNELCIR